MLLTDQQATLFNYIYPPLGNPDYRPFLSDVQVQEAQELGRALWEAKQQLGDDGSDDAISAIVDKATEIFEARKRARQRRQKAQQRHRQRKTLKRCLDAIVWAWDNPYIDPGDWTPLEDEE
jgi:hypothetical protein